MKLTQRMLNRIIREEASKFGSGESVEDRAKKDSEEVDADEQAGSLEKHIDFVKALKIEERRSVRRLKKISELKRRALKKIARII